MCVDRCLPSELMWHSSRCRVRCAALRAELAATILRRGKAVMAVCAARTPVHGVTASVRSACIALTWPWRPNVLFHLQVAPFTADRSKNRGDSSKTT